MSQPPVNASSPPPPPLYPAAAPVPGVAVQYAAAPVHGVAVQYAAAPPPTYSEAMGFAPAPGFKPPVTSQPIPNLAGPTPVVHTRVGPEPMTLRCPNCHVSIETSTRTEPGLIAWISGLLIFLFGFWCGCCLIPCCVDSCMDVHHTCPNCNAYLGRYRR